MKQDKVSQANGKTRAGASERKVAKAVGYPLTFAALCSLAFGPGYAMAVDTASSGSDASDASNGSAQPVVSNQTSNASAPSQKDETVYVFAQPDGSTKNTEVSAKLSNPDKAIELADSSTLTGIENVEGDEEYRGSGENIVWDANGNDIYYRGDTSSTPPVNLKVTYKLGGRTVTPDELAGKSGKVTIRYDYENTSKATAEVNGEQKTIFTPFVAITGMLLDNDLFSNVEAKNGRVVDDGDRTVVVGYAMPGLQESLDANRDDIDVPEYFEVTADVTDFELKSTLTMVSAGLFDGMDASKLDTSELSDSSAQLKDAMSQLEDGTGKLVDGLDQLADGAGTAKDASGKLADGAQQLADGAKTLSDGTSAMKKQSAALPDGVNQLATGASALAGGLPAAADAAGQLATGASALSSGLDSAVAGTDQLIGGADQLSGGLDQLVGDGSAANPGLTGIKAAGEGLADGIATTKNSLSELNSKLGKAEAGAQQIATGATTANSTIDQLKDYVTASVPANTKDSYGNDVAATINTYLEGLKTGNGQIVDGANNIAAGAKAGKEQLTPALATGGSLDTMSSYAQAIAQGAQKAINGVQGEGGLKQGVAAIKYGLTVLKSGDGVTNTGLQGAAAGSAQIASGATQLKGDESSGLTSAANGAQQLSSGLNQLRDKIPALISGVSKIATGTDKLKDGSTTLSDSLAKFDAAVGQLADGASSAADGSHELADGLQKFDDEGITKITDLIDGDLASASDRLDALRDAGENYTNFSGITKGTTGSVKFVYEVDAIEQ